VSGSVVVLRGDEYFYLSGFLCKWDAELVGLVELGVLCGVVVGDFVGLMDEVVGKVNGDWVMVGGRCGDVRLVVDCGGEGVRFWRYCGGVCVGSGFVGWVDFVGVGGLL